MSTTNRLLGIDLFRGIAAYAVVVVHSGDDTWGVPIAQSAIQFRLLFYFAVPFFLATSFYFMTRKPNIGFSKSFWRSRFDRIIVPYLIWSLIYLGVRLTFFFIEHKTDRFSQIIEDPLSLIFFGGTSYHLYFLPLLLSGTLLIVLTNYFTNPKFKIQYLIFLSIVSVAVDELIIVSGNQFQLGPNIAFQSLLQLGSIDISIYPIARILAVYFAWTIKCIPYFLIAVILNRFLSGRKISRPSEKTKFAHTKNAIILAIFLIVNAYGSLFLPGTAKDLLMAYSLLILGILISHKINKNTQIFASLGACSFGIYLIHPIAMNLIKILLSKSSIGIMNQVTISSMLLISITSFFLSWLVVSTALRSKWTAKYMFGV